MEHYILSNDELTLCILSQGGTLRSLRYRGEELLLRLEREEDYLQNPDYLGALVGRYANRIGGASFTLDGTRYALTPNEGRNILHGGINAPSHREWSVAERSETALTLRILSPDGENGFPGNVRMEVRYSLAGNALRIDFFGECDAPTLYAPTIHPYFRTESPHLFVNALGHLETDGELIPTGRILPCEGDFDFSSLRALPPTLDDCFPLRGENALTLSDRSYRMELTTDFPAVQVYSGHPGGAAIEPEFFPDSPNHPDFPSTVLRPGERFHRYAEYRFFPAGDTAVL